MLKGAGISIVIGALTVITGLPENVTYTYFQEPGTAVYRVGEEFSVLAEITPEVTAISPDGEILETTMPEGVYTWKFRYDRNLIHFISSDPWIETEYTEVPGTQFADLSCLTEERVSRVTFKALRATDGVVSLPVRNAVAGGLELVEYNPDKLRILPQPSVFILRFSGVVEVEVIETEPESE